MHQIQVWGLVQFCNSVKLVKTRLFKKDQINQQIVSSRAIQAKDKTMDEFIKKLIQFLREFKCDLILISIVYKQAKVII